MHVEESVHVHVYISMRACTMHLCLLEMGGDGEGSDWLKASDKCEEGELTSLASDHIR